MASPLNVDVNLISDALTIREAASRLKTFEIALPANNARHYSEALERVRAQTPGRQIISCALVRDHA